MDEYSSLSSSKSFLVRRQHRTMPVVLCTSLEANCPKSKPTSLTLPCASRQWSLELKQLPKQQQVGVVTLSAADFQQQLSLAVATALEVLMAHLARAACLRCRAVLAEYRQLTKYISFTWCLIKSASIMCCSCANVVPRLGSM